MAPTLSVDTTPSTYGTTETLKCTDAIYVSGNAYVWQKDGVTIFTQNGEISTTGKYSESIDGNTFKLIINNIVASDEGIYTASHAFADSNTLDLKVESRGTVSAKLTSDKLLEVTFKEIYPENIEAAITCDGEIVPGSFITSTADGDRFTKTWESTETFTTVPNTCSAEITLRTQVNIDFTVTEAPDEAPAEGESSGLSTGAIVSIVCGVTVTLVGSGVLLYYCTKNKAISYVVLTYDKTSPNSDGSWSFGASIGAVCVTKVTPRGPAHEKLKVGDQIHNINNVMVTGKDQTELKEMIKNKKQLTLQVSKVGGDVKSNVELNCKEGELLGFEVENLAMVTKVTEGSKFDGKLKVRNRILSINGKSTAGKSDQEVNEILKKSSQSLTLEIKRGIQSRIVSLHLKGHASSGIEIKKEENILVSALETESVAAISGDVQVNDCILSINGVSTVGLQVADIKKMMTNSVTLKLTNDVTLLELDPDHNGSFGMETFPPNGTPDRPANMVERVTPNGPAASHGIKAGDRIVSINGEKIGGKKHQEIQALLKSARHSISLKIEEAAN